MADAEAQNRLEAPLAPRWGLWLCLCLLALTALRLISLITAKTDLFFDEAQYWTWSQALDFGYFSKPPLIAWAIRGTTAVCGEGEACTRVSAPLFYAGTAAFLFFAAKALYDAKTGFWTGLVFATLPGVSFSSAIISTDVPLLCFWAAALFFAIRLIEERHWHWALLCGLAIGLGALAKYAMLYIYICGAVWLLVEPKARWLLRDARGAVLLLIPVLMLVPNVLWVVNHGLVTFHHTAANADIKGTLDHPINMLRFLGAQFGVFGPIMFPMLLWIAIRAIWKGTSENERFLLSFSMPVLVLMIVLAFLSRAHANWAATAYPAAAILVVATMLQRQRWLLLIATLAINGLALVTFLVAPAFADRTLLPGHADPFGRMLGWHASADVVARALKQDHYGTVLTDDRGMTAELLYYLRGNKVSIEAWHNPGPPKDHYQLTRPFRPSAKEPILLVTTHPASANITSHFVHVRPVAKTTVPAGAKHRRHVYLTALSGYKGAPDGR